jgi:hypothetical protein
MSLSPPQLLSTTSSRRPAHTCDRAPNRHRSTDSPALRLSTPCFTIGRQPIFNNTVMATCSADWRRAAWGPYGVARAYPDLCETVAVGMGELIISSLRVGNDTAMVATRSWRKSSLPWTYPACKPADLRARPAHWVVLTGLTGLGMGPAASGTFRVQAAVRGSWQGPSSGQTSLSARWTIRSRARHGHGKRFVGCRGVLAPGIRQS